MQEPQIELSHEPKASKTSSPIRSILKGPAPIQRAESLLSVYGQVVRLVGPPNAIDELVQDFKGFINKKKIIGAQPKPALTLEIRQHKFIIKPERFFRRPNCTVYGRSLQRFVEYSDGSKVLITHNPVDGRLVSIMGHTAERARELCHTVLHAFISEKLESQKLVRIKAISLSDPHHLGLVFLPNREIEQAMVRLNARESDLNSQAHLETFLSSTELVQYPLPIDLATNDVSEKSLHVYWCVPGHLTTEGPIFRPAQIKERIQFVWSVLLGRALVPMAEYVWRTDNVRALVIAGLRRGLWAIKALKNFRVVELSENAEINFAKLIDNFKELTHL
jgi:hypothetical protein